MDEPVGREREQAALTDAIAAAAAGAGGMILVSGEAGVGKTRVIHAVLTASGLRVLAGSASPGGTSPYAPVVAALRTHLRAFPDGLRVHRRSGWEFLGELSQPESAQAK